MPRLIDADALCKLARNHVDGTVDCNDIMRFPTIDAVPVTILDKIVDEIELHQYRLEGQDDVLYPLTPHQMTMNTAFDIALEIIERVRKENADAID